MENSPHILKQPPLKRLNLRNWTKNQSRYRCRPFFLFFWRSPDFGRRKPLNFGFRPKNHSHFGEDLFFFFFFFGEHLILGGKKLWICELSEKFRLNFRTNRLKLLLDQWKFQSRSFAHFSLFQNSPPFSKYWLRAWTQPQVFSKKRSSKKFFRQSPIYSRSQNFWLGEA